LGYFSSRLKAVEGTSSLLLGASCHVKSGNQALGIVDSTIFLADSNILSLSYIHSSRVAVSFAGELFLRARKKDVDTRRSLEAFTKVNVAFI